MLFEGGLGVVAAVVAVATGRPLLSLLNPSAVAALAGVAGALVPLFVLDRLEDLGWAPLVRIRRELLRLLPPLLGNAGVAATVAVAAAAGFGEELLFRGLVQTWTVEWCGPVAGVVLASMVFGLAHPISPAYVALAGAMGLWLGWIYHATGSLFAAAVAHGLYDYLAIRALLGAAQTRDRVTDAETG